MYMPNSIPGISIGEQRRLLQCQDSIVMTFPEVQSVWGKVGWANSATDPAPLSMVETIVNLKDPAEWPERLTQEQLIATRGRTGEAERAGWYREAGHGIVESSNGTAVSR